MPRNQPSDPVEGLTLDKAVSALSKKKMALAPIVAFKTLIEYVDGLPRVVGKPVREVQTQAELLMESMIAYLDLPYDGSDPALQGLTFRDAMIIQEARKAAHGDSAAFTRIMDRIVGPPVQKSQNLNISGDLGEFLDKVATQTKEVTIDVTAEVKPNMDDL